MASKLAKLGVGLLTGGLGLSLFNKADLARQQRKAAEAITPVDYNSLDDPLLQEQQGAARLQANSGLAGGATLRRGIFQNQANTIANVRRNAVSGGQAIAVAAANQAQTNDALARLQTAEAQDANRKQGVLMGVLGQQGSLANSDRYRKYMLARQDKARLMQASLQNEQAALDMPLELASTAAGIFLGGGGGGSLLSGGRRTTTGG